MGFFRLRINLFRLSRLKSLQWLEQKDLCYEPRYRISWGNHVRSSYTRQRQITLYGWKSVFEWASNCSRNFAADISFTSCSSSVSKKMTQLTRKRVDEGWEFKQAVASSFLPVARFLTVAHIDLLHHQLIPDPYIDANELKCLWVSDADWTYRTLHVPEVNFWTYPARSFGFRRLRYGSRCILQR
jgi:hypothetical protein